MHAWITLLALVKPDTVIADHAPTALLAAHIAGIPCVAFGSGFEIPPQVIPMPTIRPWESIDIAKLEQSEKLVLGQVNAVSLALGGSDLITYWRFFRLHSFWRHLRSWIITESEKMLPI